MNTLESELDKKIQDARSFLAGKIRRTPLEESPELSRILGVPTSLKLEFLQKTGSFKIRGALYRLSLLTKEERERGIVVCSVGNFGKAIATAAPAFSMRPTVVVPYSIDRARYESMKALGADVWISPFPGYDDTDVWARELAESREKLFISPFDDMAMLAGGGTIAAEIFEDLPEAQTFIVPVGGGGLSAGFAFYVKQQNADCTVVGCQHQDSAGLPLSLASGSAITRMPPIKTIACGVEGGIGKLPFEILKSRIDHIAVASEEEICEAVRWTLKRHQYLIEPSAAVTIAVCITKKIWRPIAGPIIVVLSGRNISTDMLKRILG